MARGGRCPFDGIEHISKTKERKTAGEEKTPLSGNPGKIFAWSITLNYSSLYGEKTGDRLENGQVMRQGRHSQNKRCHFSIYSKSAEWQIRIS